jgi:hypothetical protein
MEIESDSVIAFLDVLVIRKEMTLATKVYRKPNHTGQYLSFNPNYPPHVKRGLIQSLHSRASTIRQEQQDLLNEISSLSHYLCSLVIPKVSLTRSLIPRVAVI